MNKGLNTIITMNLPVIVIFYYSLKFLYGVFFRDSLSYFLSTCSFEAEDFLLLIFLKVQCEYFVII